MHKLIECVQQSVYMRYKNPIKAILVRGRIITFFNKISCEWNTSWVVHTLYNDFNTI